MSLGRPSAVIAPGQGVVPSGDPILDSLALSPADLQLLARANPQLYAEYQARTTALIRINEKARCEGSLIEFVRRAWREIESRPFDENWHHRVVADHMERIAYGEIRNLIINIPPRHSKTLIVNVFFPAWVWCRSEILPLSGPQVSFLCVSYGATLSEEIAVKMRRLVEGEWYQSLWGEKTKLLEDQRNRANFANVSGGERISSSIEGGILGRGALVQILDDVQTRRGADSAVERASSLQGMSDLSTRVTDPRISAKVLIMQRLHVNDATDWALKNWPSDTTHLMFPARFESDRACLADERLYDGELLWPEVWSEEELTKIESGLAALDGDVLSDYAFCTPAESPVLMADLSLKPIGEIQVGDKLVGFTTDCTGQNGQKFARRRLVPTTVRAVHRSIQDVVKVTLDSGEALRCTADHNWYTGRNPGRPGNKADAGHKLYMPASPTRRLMRVCPSRLPDLSSPEDARDAGWLSGFFDGEGSASATLRRSGDTTTSQITFTQGTDRNKPLCDKLERLLTKFGFCFAYGDHVRSDRRVCKDGSMVKQRTYFIKKSPYGRTKKGAGIEQHQLFLHVVQPTKWRQRIIDAAYCTNWVMSKERPTSIESDGREEVFGLTTDTGNYVVWGIASSNSGQFQQNPRPRSGGIVNKDDWKVWPEWTPRPDDVRRMPNGATFVPLPEVSRVILCLDTALSEKETADWNACVVLGVWHRSRELVQVVGHEAKIDDGEQPRVIVMGAWMSRCKLNDETLGRNGKPQGLVQRVVATGRQFNADEVIIENKTRGLDVKNEIERQLSDLPFRIRLFNPGKHGDKAARLNSVQPLFSQGLVYMPGNCRVAHDRAGAEYVVVDEFVWAQEIMTQCEAVPRGAHDDMADALVQGLICLREDGYLALTQEYIAQQVQARMFKGKRTVIRDSYGV